MSDESKKNILRNDLLIIAVLTAFSFVIPNGYYVFTGDHAFYFPAIFKVMDPSLYPGDMMLTIDLLQMTLFDETILYPINNMGLNFFQSIFALSIVTRFIYFYSVFHIALYLTNDRTFSLLSVFLFIAGIHINGTAVATMDANLIPRLMGRALALASLALLFYKRRVPSAILLSTAIFMHVLTAIPFIIFFVLDTLYEAYKVKKPSADILIGLIITIAAFVGFAATTSSPGTGFFTVLDAEWEMIVRARDYYAFITSWPVVAYPLMAASIIFFIIGRLELAEIFEDKIKGRQCTWLFLIPLALTLFSFIAVDIFKSHFFAQMMFTRNLDLWKIFCTLLFARYAYLAMRDDEPRPVKNALLIGVLIALLLPAKYYSGYMESGTESFLLIFLPPLLYIWLREKLQIAPSHLSDIAAFALFTIYGIILFYLVLLPLDKILLPYIIAVIIISAGFSALLKYKREIIHRKKTATTVFIVTVVLSILLLPMLKVTPLYARDKNFVTACKWIRANTSKSDIFIAAPFKRSGWMVRAACLRSVFYSYKDGGHVLYSQEYSKEWRKRLSLSELLRRSVKNSAQFRMNLDRINGEYGTDYIFSTSRLPLPYEPVFRSGPYSIYETEPGYFMRSGAGKMP